MTNYISDELLSNAADHNLFGEDIKILFTKLAGNFDLVQVYQHSVEGTDKFDITTKKQIKSYIDLYVHFASSGVDIYNCISHIFSDTGPLYTYDLRSKYASYSINHMAFKQHIKPGKSLSFIEKVAFMNSLVTSFREGTEFISEVLLHFQSMNTIYLEQDINKKFYQRNKYLKNRIDYFSNKSEFSFLLSGIDRDLRNSFSHLSYYIDYKKNNVVCKNKGEILKVYSFEEFIKLHSLLSNNVMSFMLAINFLLLANLDPKTFENNYSQLT